MKQYLIQIKDLIERGILRIFPSSNSLDSVPSGRQYSEAVSNRVRSARITTSLQYTAWRAVPWLGLSLILMLFISCSTSKHATQLVHDVRIDTDYMTNLQYDSIYIYHDRLQTDTILHSPSKGERKGVLIKDISVEYRYKLLRDTVRIIQRDSIPYEVTVVETKEITRPLTWYDHLCRISLWFKIGFLSFAIYKTLRR